MSAPEVRPDSLPLRVATVEVTKAVITPHAAGDFTCHIHARYKDGSSSTLDGSGASEPLAVAAAVSHLCLKPIKITSFEVVSRQAGQMQCVVAVAEDLNSPQRAGVGRFVAQQRDAGLVIAALRAASHAALFKPAYRANNQKILRAWSREMMEELEQTLELNAFSELKRMEAEGIVLEYMNRVASAAVVTAANYPEPDSILSLYDTSAWLFDSQGRRRDSYTNTSLWLAWYPGLDNDHLTVDKIIASMPAAPDTAIPWIVKLFENPTSWLRFRGAVDLEDHDVLHVLLGRGLQDQDEAFVLGFAMGTAKRVSWFEYRIFKFVLARLYPEPYRIPTFLQPAFELGVHCGQETGNRNLYQQPLKELRTLTLREARSEAGMDKRILRKYYEREQQRIPFTIASLRLP